MNLHGGAVLYRIGIILTEFSVSGIVGDPVILGHFIKYPLIFTFQKKRVLCI